MPPSVKRSPEPKAWRRGSTWLPRRHAPSQPRSVADPGWAARTPEANDLLLKTGTGVATHLANQAAWTALAASHHASGMASAASVTMLNASLHGLAGWVDIKPAVVGAAVTAYETANATMRPAPECMENRDEYVADNFINPA